MIFDDKLTKIKLLKSKKNLRYTKNNKVFLNLELTKTNLDIYMDARAFKKDKNYKFLWIGDGNIFLRKDKNSIII